MSKNSRNESRRQFLKAGVVGGAALLSPSFKATAATAPLASPEALSGSQSPAWTNDLIIYEIGSTQAFTSPTGPGTGTFGSMAERLAYLEELGITGLWIDPPSLQESHRFFYNMWCRYAVMEPDKFDPVLGTEEQLQAMVEEAHRRGIRVFPDVKTHGVMDFSPLVKQHPDWFRGSHWRMADYDWYGGHTDLDDWWVKIWTDCIAKYKVDGFRLDVDLFRPDLWKRIRENAAAAGHPILIFEEDNPAIPGVTEFSQHETAIYDYESTTENEVLTYDLPAFYERKYGDAAAYQVTIEYTDGTKDLGSSDGQGRLRIHLDDAAIQSAFTSPTLRIHLSRAERFGTKDVRRRRDEMGDTR